MFSVSKTPSELGNLMLKTFQLTLTWQDLAHTHMHFWYVILKGGIFYPWGREKISPPFKNTLTPPSPFPTLPRRWGINTAMISRFGSERSWLESFSSFYWANSSGLGSKIPSELIGSKDQPSLYEKKQMIWPRNVQFWNYFYTNSTLNKLPSIWRQTRCMNYFKH